MNAKRGGHAMTVVDGQILAVGGWDSSEFLKSVEAFDARKVRTFVCQAGRPVRQADFKVATWYGCEGPHQLKGIAFLVLLFERLDEHALISRPPVRTWLHYHALHWALSCM